MKKIYVNPELIVIRIATQQMIATSGPLLGGTTDNVDDLLSRESFDVFDDENVNYDNF